MSKNKMLTPVVEQWPSWFGRLGFPESWQQFLDAETIRVEEFREDGTVVVRAELPGIDPERDVEVTVVDGMLRIHAERMRQEMTDEAKQHYRSEFRYGAFTRVVALPPGTTESDITASYRDGVLEVRMPVQMEKPPARKIEVARG